MAGGDLAELLTFPEDLMMRRRRKTKRKRTTRPKVIFGGKVLKEVRDLCVTVGILLDLCAAGWTEGEADRQTGRRIHKRKVPNRGGIKAAKQDRKRGSKRRRDSQTESQTYRETDRQIHNYTDRQRHSYTDRQTQTKLTEAERLKVATQNSK